MTFPVVAATNYSEETADTTTHDVLVPTGISAGHLLMLFVGIDGLTVTQPTVTGWTNLIFANGAGSNSIGVWYKFAAGGETDFTYTSSVSERSSNLTWRVTGAYASAPPEVSSGGPDGFISSADFASVTTSWGSDDNLFVVFVGADSTSPGFTVNTYPTNYTDNQFTDKTGNTAGDAGVAVASRNLTASTDDPGNLVLANAVNLTGRTIVIRPAAPGGGGGAVTDPFGMAGFFGG